jgi:hypothetical protein
MVVVVVKRFMATKAQSNIDYLKTLYDHKPTADYSKEKFALNYYQK